MANKRQLKKSINYACNDLAYATFLTELASEGKGHTEFNDILTRIAELKAQSLQAASFAFDKAPKDFENRKEYNKARSAYYAKAYAKFNNEFTSRLQALVDDLNKHLAK